MKNMSPNQEKLHNLLEDIFINNVKKLFHLQGILKGIVTRGK